MRALSALALGVALVGCGAAAPTPRAATVPTEPVLALADGAPTTVAEVAGARPLVLDLYATWCAACRKQIAHLEELAATFGDAVAVIGVDVGEELELARTFAAREDIDYPVVVDPELRFADALGVSSLPALLVVAADGTIVHLGREVDEAVWAQVRALLADAP
ncbi:MAG: TlpA disulfide reductase family protein [Kofleriaceae bacterium]